jgi:hypothetical protein
MRFRSFNAVAFAAVTVALSAVGAASADAPSAVPGQPSCYGHEHAQIAQDWKNIPGEPSGFGRLTRFYGGSPQEGNAEVRGDCAGAP